MNAILTLKFSIFITNSLEQFKQLKFMKTSSRLPVKLILLLFIGTFLGCNSSNKTDTDTSKNAIVILKFKAQPDKGAKVVSELTKLIEEVKNEPHFVQIKMHVDPEDSTNILLYEEWEDLTYYRTEHMNTDHLQGFMVASQNFLLGPPDVTFWKLKHTFK